MLLMRQKIAQEGKSGMSLMDQEKIDNSKKTWEQIVAENRKQFMRNMQ